MQILCLFGLIFYSSIISHLLVADFGLLWMCMWSILLRLTLFSKWIGKSNREYFHIQARDGHFSPRWDLFLQFLEGKHFGWQVRLGRNGVEEVLELGSLSDYEQKGLEALKEELQSSIQKGLDFVKPQHTWISPFQQIITNQVPPNVIRFEKKLEVGQSSLWHSLILWCGPRSWIPSGLVLCNKISWKYGVPVYTVWLLVATQLKCVTGCWEL